MHPFHLITKGVISLLRSKVVLPNRIMKNGGIATETMLLSKKAWTKKGKVCNTRGDIYLTTRRLVYIGIGNLFYKSIEWHIPLWQVSDITVEKGMLGTHHLSFKAAETDYRVSVDFAGDFHTCLLSAIGDAHNAEERPTFGV
jgi:hypothetical protein